MSAEFRLYPDRLGKVARTGAVESVQEAELRLDEAVSSVVIQGFLERAARAYWELITRWTLGLIRVSSDGGDQCVVLIAPPFVLLRFHAPEYDVSEDHGSVTWLIKRGILVSREGQHRGALRLSVAAADGANGTCHLHAPHGGPELLSMAARQRPVRTGGRLGVRADAAAHPPDRDPGVPATACDDGRGGLAASSVYRAGLMSSARCCRFKPPRWGSRRRTLGSLRLLLFAQSRSSSKASNSFRAHGDWLDATTFCHRHPFFPAGSQRKLIPSRK